MRKEIPSVRPTVKEPKPVDPELFDSDWNRFDAFVTALEICFQLQPSKFTLEEQKIAYASMFLRGRAQNWWLKEQSIWLAGPDQPTKMWADFVAEMLSAFGEHYKRADALREMQTLSQTGDYVLINDYLNKM